MEASFFTATGIVDHAGNNVGVEEMMAISKHSVENDSESVDQWTAMVNAGEDGRNKYLSSIGQNLGVTVDGLTG